VSSPPPRDDRPSLSLTDDSSGLVVSFLALLAVVYALVALGNVLFGVFLATLLVGGFLAVRLARRLLGLVERLVAAREREARAAEARAAAAAESASDVRFEPETAASDRRDGQQTTTDETGTEEWAD
jgi:hypothetical protein